MSRELSQDLRRGLREFLKSRYYCLNRQRVKNKKVEDAYEETHYFDIDKHAVADALRLFPQGYRQD